MNSISIWRLSPGIINVVDPRLPDLYVRIATECQHRAITPQSLRVLEQILPREVEKSKHFQDFSRLEVALAFLTFGLSMREILRFLNITQFFAIVAIMIGSFSKESQKQFC